MGSTTTGRCQPADELEGVGGVAVARAPSCGGGRRGRAGTTASVDLPPTAVDGEGVRDDGGKHSRAAPVNHRLDLGGLGLDLDHHGRHYHLGAVEDEEHHHAESPVDG